MVKPTEHEIVRRLNPILREMSRCFPSNHRLTPWSTGGTTKNWHLNPHVQWTDRLWWNACNPCLQQTAWACNLKKPWLNQHVTQLWPSICASLFCSLEDWFKKNKKKCPRVVSSNAAECTTLRDEMCVLGQNAINVLRELKHATAWTQCVTVHSDNKLKKLMCKTVHEKNVVRVKCDVYKKIFYGSLGFEPYILWSTVLTNNFRFGTVQMSSPAPFLMCAWCSTSSWAQEETRDFRSCGMSVLVQINIITPTFSLNRCVGTTRPSTSQCVHGKFFFFEKRKTSAVMRVFGGTVHINDVMRKMSNQRQPKIPPVLHMLKYLSHRAGLESNSTKSSFTTDYPRHCPLAVLGNRRKLVKKNGCSAPLRRRWLSTTFQEAMWNTGHIGGSTISLATPKHRAASFVPKMSVSRTACTILHSSSARNTLISNARPANL